MMRTLFAKWFAPDSFRPRKRRTACRPTGRFRWFVPRLEWLEDRIAPATFFVATTGSDANNGLTAGTPFLTIQHALNVAASPVNPGPDTIMVAPGTYQEQLIINDPSMVTLTGAGAGNSIIQSPLILAPDETGGRQEIVEMASPSNVVMSGFTVTGPVANPGNPVGPSGIGIDFGILAVGAGTLDLSATTVTDTLFGGALNTQQTANGIGVGDQATGRVGHANINDVTVTDYNKVGIRVDNTGTTATITNSFITGMGPNPVIAQNGIQISRGAVATVSGNTVSLNEFAGGPPGSGTGGPDLFTDTNGDGILDFQAGAGTTIEGNNVFDNDIGIYSTPFGDPSLGPAASVTGNTVLNNRFHGVVLDAGNTTASNNTISGSLNGLVVVSFTGNAPNSVATITGNTISNNTEKGVWVVDQSVDGLFPVATVLRNTIFNNGTGVVVGGGPNPPDSVNQIENDHTVISQNSIFDNTPGLGIDLGDDGVTLNAPPGKSPGPNNFVNFPVLTSGVIEGANLDLQGFALPGSVIELFIAAPDPTGFGEGKTYLVTLTEGSAADLDNTVGTYGPGPINGLSQGTNTTNRFRFVIPLASLPAPVVAGTVLTSTATLSEPFTSEFSGNITVTQLPPSPSPSPSPVADVSLTKEVNQTTPIFGTLVTYTLIAHNNGPDTATGVVVTDVLPAGLVFVSATPSQGLFNPGSGQWFIGTLTNGTTATLQITGIVATVGPITNVASVLSLDVDPNLANNISAVTINGMFSPEQISKALFLSSSNSPLNAATLAAEEALFNELFPIAVNIWDTLLSLAQSVLAARNEPGPGNGGVPVFEGNWLGSPLVVYADPFGGQVTAVQVGAFDFLYENNAVAGVRLV